MNSLFAGTTDYQSRHQEEGELSVSRRKGLFSRILISLVAVGGSLLLSAGAMAQTAVIPPGAGTEASPYLMSTVNHLVWLSEYTTTETEDISTEGKYFLMTQDIDTSPTAEWENGFPPIGNEEKPFLGAFVGNHHSIVDLTLSGNNPQLGLFGCVGESGTVASVGLQHVTVAPGSPADGVVAGTLIGVNKGLVYNCYAEADDEDEGLTLTGAGDQATVGGLIGLNETTAIVSDTSTSLPMATDGIVGGIVGTNKGTLSKSYSVGTISGAVVGGLVGSAIGGRIDNCYAVSPLTATDTAGGLVGMMSQSAQVDKSYAACTIKNSGANTGGLVGVGDDTQTVTASYWDLHLSGLVLSDGGAAKTDLQMKKVYTYEGYDFATVWDFPRTGMNQGYPTLRMMGEGGAAFNLFVLVPGGFGTVEVDPMLEEDQETYAVGTSVTLTAKPKDGAKFLRWEGDVVVANELVTTVAMTRNQTVRAIFYKEITSVNDLVTTVAPSMNGFFVLTQDLDLSTIENFSPIGSASKPFTGYFEGNGHTISGLTIDAAAANDQGLFAALGKNATVKSIKFDNPTIVGKNNVGVLAGTSTGAEVVDCSVTAGSVTGEEFVGSLIGKNDAKANIDNFASTGVDISGLTNIGGTVGANLGKSVIYASAIEAAKLSASGFDSFIGGSVGLNDGSYIFGLSTLNGEIDGFNTNGGAVAHNTNGGEVLQIASDMAVSGYDYTGGLIGLNEGNVLETTVTGNVLGHSYVGGLIGSNATGTSVAICRSFGQVDGQNYVGGLIGDNFGGVQYAFAIGEVTGDDTVGGLIGSNAGDLSDVYAMGSPWGDSYVGGLVGYQDAGTIERAYAAGRLSEGGVYSGGLIGANNGGKVIDCYWNTETTQRDNSEGGVGVTSEEMKSAATFANWDFEDVWSISEGNSFPYFDFSIEPLWFKTFVTGTPGCSVQIIGPPDAKYQLGMELTLIALPAEGTIFRGWRGDVSDSLSSQTTIKIDNHKVVTAIFSKTYEIWTLDDLQNLPEADLNGKYLVMADIDASETRNWNDGLGFAPIGKNSSFTGILDGQGFTVSNMYIDRSEEEYAGLFASLSGRAEVSNYNLRSFKVCGSRYVGALAGVADNSTVTSCTATDLEVTGSYNYNTGSYFAGIGGLIGFNSGVLTDSEVGGKVNALDNYSYVGGLVGWDAGLLVNVRSLAEVSGFMKQSYVGGLTGYEGGKVSSASVVSSIHGGYCTGGLIGSTSAQARVSEVSARCSVDTRGEETTGALSAGGLIGLNYGAVSGALADGSVESLDGQPNAYWGGLIGYNGGPVEDAWSSGTVFANSNLGGLIGVNVADVKNCHSETSVLGNAEGAYAGGLIGLNSGSVASCYAVEDVFGGTNVGGLMGDNSGKVSSCVAKGSIVGEDQAGGLVGANSGSIMTSFASGLVAGADYVGGFVGENMPSSEITNCYATGSVKGADYIGGFVGSNGASSSLTSVYSIGPCTSTIIGSNMGGLVGANAGVVTSGYWDVNTSKLIVSAGGVGVETEKMKQQASFVGFDFEEVWGIDENLTYPYLQAKVVPQPTGTFTLDVVIVGDGAVTLDPEETAYDAGTLVELTAVPDNEQTFFKGWEGPVIGDKKSATVKVLMDSDKTVQANFVKINEIYYLSDLVAIGNGNMNEYYRLMRDLDASISSTTSIMPLGSAEKPFAGYFDGNGKAIKNLSIAGSESEYAGLFGVTGTESEIFDLALENLSVDGSTSTTAVGMLVGVNGGTINRVSVNGSVSGNAQVGGLAGANYGLIENCFARGEVKGDAQTGGLVGNNCGQILTSYAATQLTGSAIGGLVGTVAEDKSYVPKNSYWDKTFSGSSVSAAGTGYTTEEMRTTSNYLDWDFENIWERSNALNDGYPVLRKLTEIGYAQVMLEPEEAREAGARWIINETEYESGEVVAIPTKQVVSVSFKDVPGWKTPEAQGVIAYAGETKVWTRTYVKQFGSLRVLLQPDTVSALGARWYCGGKEYKSGDIIYNLPAASTCTLTFKSIEGWNAPAEVVVTIEKDTVLTYNGVYEEIPAGAVKVTLAPKEAIEQGAKWAIDGGKWQDSGAYIRYVTVGSHAITFKTIDGWNVPPEQTIYVEKGKTVSMIVSYTRLLDMKLISSQFSSGVDAAIAPGEAVDLNWKINANAQVDVPFWCEVFASKTGGFDQMRFGTAVTSSYLADGAAKGDQTLEAANPLTLKAVPDGVYTLVPSINRGSISGRVDEYSFVNNWLPIAGKRLHVKNPKVPSCDLEMLETIAYEIDKNNPTRVLVTGTIRNNGPDDLDRSGAWIEGFYGTMTAEATLMPQGSMGNGFLVQNLPAGETYDFALTGYVPTGVATRGVCVMVDSTDIVPETNETNNNCGVFYDPSILPAPAENNIDLAVIDFAIDEKQVAPAQVAPGEKLSYDVTVLNKGTAMPEGDIWLEVFASRDGGVSFVGGSTAVWSQKITPPALGQSAVYSLEKPINAIGDGMYTLVAVVNRKGAGDNPGDITPWDNRMASADGRISLSTPVDAAANVNLVWSEGPVFTQVGNKMTVSGTIKNTGTSKSGIFWTEVYIGTQQYSTGYYFRDKVIAGGVRCAGLAPGETQEISVTGSVAAGKVIGALIDCTNLVPETDETDNYDYSALTE